MFWFLMILLLLAVGAGVYAVGLYNRLVSSRQRASEAWSGIDVQLKRRRNLIPNLVETVKAYAGHEKTVLEEVTRTRAQAASAEVDGGVKDRAQAEGMLGAAIARVLAVAEDYPDLRASENFQQMQESLEEIEDSIQNARRYYNGSVRDLNTRVQSFPSNLVASRFGFSERDYFELSNPTDRELPRVSF